MPCNFSYAHYERILKDAKRAGYRIVGCGEFAKKPPKPPYIVLRHDIEFYPDRAAEMAAIERRLGVRSTYFVRLHANEYNPMGYKTYDALREIAKCGHEIGLHEESTDVSRIFREDFAAVLKRDKAILELLIGRKVRGFSSHRDFTGYDNLARWRRESPKKYGFEYQAYEDRFFKGATYVSDSLVAWKSFENGTPTGRKDCLRKYIAERKQRIYALVHPRGWHHRAYHTR